MEKSSADGRAPENHLKVVVDARFLATGTGLARYTGELLTALIQRQRGGLDQDLRYAIVVRQASDFSHLPTGDYQRLYADVDHYTLAEQVVLPRLARSVRADVFFAPHFNIPLAVPTPVVATVHDLILHRHPGQASRFKQQLYRAVMRGAVMRAQRIIAVSNATAADLRACYGPRISRRLTVISEGVSEVFRPSPASEVAALLARLGLISGNYFLYVGNAKPHKNVPALLRAWQISNAPGELVLVGAQELPDPLPRGVRRVTGLDDEGLAALYSAARALVTMSLDEGYCLPVAEALACGCPVIASNLPSIAETAAGHARLLAPDVEAFARALASPISLPSPVRVGEWERAAQATGHVLRSVVR